MIHGKTTISSQNALYTHERHSSRSRIVWDSQIVFPGRMLLTDVVVSHSLTAQRGSAATRKQGVKNRKYAAVAACLGAELLNVSADTCGGLASDAIKLVQAIGEEGERWNAGT